MDELAATLRDVLARGPSLRIAILFGSRARGTARPDSDVYVAVLPSDASLSLAAENALGAELERAARLPVDLVRLDQASDALAWRIARDGIVLLSDPPFAAGRWIARVGIEHDEHAELEARAVRTYAAALARGAPR